jgi:hypothetical protein
MGRKFALRRNGRASFSQAAVPTFEFVFIGVTAGCGIDFSYVENDSRSSNSERQFAPR